MESDKKQNWFSLILPLLLVLAIIILAVLYNNYPSYRADEIEHNCVEKLREFSALQKHVLHNAADGKKTYRDWEYLTQRGYYPLELVPDDLIDHYDFAVFDLQTDPHDYNTKTGKIISYTIVAVPESHNKYGLRTFAIGEEDNHRPIYCFIGDEKVFEFSLKNRCFALMNQTQWIEYQPLR